MTESERPHSAEARLAERLDSLVEVITSIASLDFSKRAPVGSSGDGIDAVSMGLNMLAEELEVSIVSRTELTAAIEELRRTEQRLEFLLTNGPTVIYTCAPEPPYARTFVSDNITETLGYAPREVLATPGFWGDHIHPDDRDRVFAEMSDLLVAHGRHQQEYRFRHQDGGWRWIRNVVRVVPSHDGRPVELVGNLIDVSALKEAAIEHATILQTAIDGFWVTDQEGRFLEVNDAYCRMSGYSRTELLRMRIPDVEATEAHEDTRHHIAKVIAEGSDRFETRHRRKDGSLFDVEVSVQSSSQRGGLLVVFLCDITAQKRTQAELHDLNRNLERVVTERTGELRQSERRFHDLFEFAVDAVVISNSEGLITLVNRRAETLFGYAREEIIGQPVEKLVPESVRSEHISLRNMLPSADAARAMGRSNFRARKKDGTIFPADISLAPIASSEGPLVAAVVCDITERKRLEEIRARAAEALLRAHADFRRVIDKAPNGITIRRGRALIYTNAAFASWLGYGDPAQLIGLDILDMVYSEDRETVVRRLANAEQHGTSEASEIRTLRRDGTVTALSLSASQVIEFEGAPAYITVVRDMTERNKMEAQLLLSDRMASVGMLAAGVAHEINNPLGAAMANLEVASKLVADLLQTPGAPSTLVELDGLLTDAREGAERVRQIVRDLKIFSRSEEDKVGRVDVHRVLDSTLRMAWNEVRHRARLVKDYGKVEAVAANEARLGQVFLNLVVNAAQAIPEGRAEENQIRVATRMDERGRVVIEVRDTGPGIPPDVMRQLFTPFFTTKPIGAGTGLGLSICHRIVSALGGEIEVESRPGEGAVFRVSLLAAAPESAEPLPAPAGSTAPTTRRGRILIIDDDAMVAKGLSRILAREHEVMIANGAMAGMNRIRAGERFDVILCDLMMPNMTGMEFYGELQGVAPELAERVIFVTGGAFTAKAQAFLNEVPNTRLEKPIDSHNLQALIRAVLGNLRHLVPENLTP